MLPSGYLLVRNLHTLVAKSHRHLWRKRGGSFQWLGLSGLSHDSWDFWTGLQAPWFSKSLTYLLNNSQRVIRLVLVGGFNSISVVWEYRPNSKHKQNITKQWKPAPSHSSELQMKRCHCHIQWPFQEPINWRYLPYIRPIFQAYVREYPPKIWPYMVQYLHFRILKFPLTHGAIYGNVYVPQQQEQYHLW